MSAPAASVVAPATMPPPPTVARPAPGLTARLGTHLVVPALLAGGLAWWDPATRGGPPLCPYAALTGHACPGCGLTRAVGSLLRGRVHDAIALHPIAPLLVAEVVVACLAFVLLGDTARRRAPAWLLPAALVVNTVLLVGTWTVRGLTGDLAGLA